MTKNVLADPSVPRSGQKSRRVAGRFAFFAGVMAASTSSVAIAQSRSSVPQATAVNAPRVDNKSASISVAARYDSNIARLSAFQAQQADIVQDDVSISPSVDINYSRSIGPHQVGIAALLGYSFYNRNTQLNRENLSIQPFAYLDLPICDLSVSGNLSRRRSDLGDFIVVVDNPATAINNTETFKEVSGRLICGDSYGLRPTFEVSHATGSNSEPVRRLANYRTTRIQPGLGYSSPTLGEISLYAVRQEDELVNRPIGDGRLAGFTLRGAGVSYQRAIGSRLNFSGSVSQVEVTPNDPRTPSNSGINASVGLTVVATPRLQLALGASREFSSSLTSSADYELAESYSLTANYAVNDRLYLRAGGSISPRQVFYSVEPVEPFIGKQTQYGISAGANYNLNQRLRLGLDGGYISRSTGLPGYDYSGYNVTLSLSFSL